MKILFLTMTQVRDLNQGSIYTDLLSEFKRAGHELYLVHPLPRRMKLPTTHDFIDDVHYLRVRTGNLTGVSPIEKGLSMLALERLFSRAIKEYFSEVRFDLVLYSTPPIMFDRVVRLVRKRDKAATYLLLKDIFPQNALDLGMLRKINPLYWYFRFKEKRLYRRADYIGCMSPANVSYILEHNPRIPESALEVCPNSVKPSELVISKEERAGLRVNYGIPQDKTIFLYGGNLGKPQGIDFLIDILQSNRNREEIFILIVGSGTELKKLERYFSQDQPRNAILLDRLPRKEYQTFVQLCDVGLILLDQRFTIPNFPSRLLSYMMASIPVLAATDRSTDLGRIMEENKFGFWCEHGDIQAFNRCVTLLLDSELRKEMGANARRYLEAHYTARHSYEIIMKHFEK